MQFSELAAWVPIFAYFSIVLGLFARIYTSLSWTPQSRGKAYVFVFVALAIASFGYTWFYLLKFIAWSFADYDKSNDSALGAPLFIRMSRWLMNTSLFEQAWTKASVSRLNWWWSQQVCLFAVGAWTTFLAIEGRRHQVKHLWAYMLLGQFVAIAVAANLFYLALVLAGPRPAAARPPKFKSTVPPVLWVPVIVALGNVAFSPSADEQTFLPNLLAMHILLFLPLVAPDHLFQNSPHLQFPMKTAGLYFIIFASSMVMHIRITNIAFARADSVSDFLRTAWSVLHSHPAQSSIGWDAIWTSISFIVWTLLQPLEQESREKIKGLIKAFYLVLATPLVSVGVLAALH